MAVLASKLTTSHGNRDRWLARGMLNWLKLSKTELTRCNKSALTPPRSSGCPSVCFFDAQAKAPSNN